LFIESIKELAKKAKKTIVLPESGDVRTLTAARNILSEGFAAVILIGDSGEINKLAADNGLDLSGAQFVSPADCGKTGELADKLYELRKNKGMTPEQAKDLLLNDSLYFGAMMVKTGMADGMVAGAVRSTADVMGTALKVIKTAPGVSVVSTCFLMVMPDESYGHKGVYAFADCALNQNPSSEELASIAISTAQTFKTLTDAEPLVAMLSHSTKGSAKHADIDKVTEAVRFAREKAPELKLDGELQLDAAIIPAIGSKKAPDSGIAGKANVLVFPDLDAGNIGYKLVERLAGASAFGPITQGLAKPVNDLSRGCSADDIAGTVAITALQAQNI